MYTRNWGDFGQLGMGAGFPGNEWMFLVFVLAAPFIIIALLWSLVWKGLGLWHSARRGQYWWFAILLVVNTLGILDIIYLFFVANLKFKDLFSTKVHGESHHS
ncbi:MAG: DUF5652 family protein [Patescibacteria group bacterium]